MKKFFSLMLLINILLSTGEFTAGSQDAQHYKETLGSLFSRILNTNSDSLRLTLNDSIKILIDNYAASDSVLLHNFKGLRYLGEIMSPDSKIKLITWNLILKEGGNKYFCYIIKKGARGEKNHLYKLTGENREETPDTNRIYNPGDWYGALYYSIQPFFCGKELHYVLLGLDYGNSMITRKIIDVLTFTPQGDLLFGYKCFNRGKNTATRAVLEYSSEGVVTLRMHNPKTIVFDRLAIISDDNNRNPGNLGSEYRFDGYVLKKGMWNFVSNIDVRNKKQK